MKPIFYILDEGKFHELLKTSANTKRGAVQILIKLYWTWCHNVFVTHTLSEGFYASVGQCKTKWKRYYLIFLKGGGNSVFAKAQQKIFSLDNFG